MAGIRISCPGCNKFIQVSPWQITAPADHRIIKMIAPYGAEYRCPQGAVYTVLPTKQEIHINSPDVADHETWLEVEKSVPAPRIPHRRIVVMSRVYAAIVGLSFSLIVMNVLLDNVFLVALWAIVMLLNLRSAVKIERR